jgi:hypothetical protein
MFPYKFALFPVLFLLGSISVIGVGCGGKTIQHPEDHERYLRIDRAVESLRDAYVNKDSSELVSLMMPLDQLERLQEEARGDFETFSAITLDFAIERIMIEGDNIDVFVHWQGLWKKMRMILASVSEAMRNCNGSAHSRFCCAGFKAMLPSV